MKKVFFLDRDGVIIEDANYLSSPEQVVLCPGTPEAFRMIKAAGYEIVVVSNQSGIARGYFTYDDLAKVEKHRYPITITPFISKFTLISLEMHIKYFFCFL